MNTERKIRTILIAAAVAGLLIAAAGIPISRAESRAEKVCALRQGDAFVFGRNVYEIERVRAHADGTCTYTLRMK